MYKIKKIPFYIEKEIYQYNSYFVEIIVDFFFFLPTESWTIMKSPGPLRTSLVCLRGWQIWSNSNLRTTKSSPSPVMLSWVWLTWRFWVWVWTTSHPSKTMPWRAWSLCSNCKCGRRVQERQLLLFMQNSVKCMKGDFVKINYRSFVKNEVTFIWLIYSKLYNYYYVINTSLIIDFRLSEVGIYLCCF